MRRSDLLRPQRDVCSSRRASPGVGVRVCVNGCMLGGGCFKSLYV